MFADVMRWWREFQMWRRAFPLDPVGDWLPEDQRQMRAFMDGPTGRKLAAHLRQHVTVATFRATASGDLLRCAAVNGQRTLLAALDGYSNFDGQGQPDELAEEIASGDLAEISELERKYQP